MKAYKVLSVGLNGQLYSAINDSKFTMRYSKTKVNLPKFEGSKLFCFARLEDAKRFIGGYNPKQEIWEVEVTGLKPAHVVKIVDIYESLRAFKNFWKKNGHVNNWEIELTQPITGTYFANSIKLVRKIK
jgi:hypothetical protein